MMRYKLVIAEKPSVAQSLAAVIGATARKDGYLEGNGWRVSWCVGHLAGLADADSYDPKYANQLLLSEKLYPHLIEIDETAQSRLEQMMPQLAKEAGATEELKASDPMKWVGLMNTCKAQAEEILMAELINS